MRRPGQALELRDAQRFSVNEDGSVYLLVETDPPIEDDWGYDEPLTAADVLAGALRIMSADLLADAIVLERRRANG